MDPHSSSFTTDKDENINGVTKVQWRSGPSYKQIQASLPTPVKKIYNQDDISASCSTRQPSLSRTYDSRDDLSVDLIDMMISDDDLSIDLDNDTLCKPLSPRESRCASIDHTKSALSSITIVKKASRREWHRSSSVPYGPTPMTPKSAPIEICTESNPSFRSRKVYDMKNKLRTLEVKYHQQKLEPIRKSVIQQPNLDVVRVSKPISKKRSMNRRTKVIKTANLRERVRESAGEIICVNLIIGFFYFIFLLYRDFISQAVKL